MIAGHPFHLTRRQRGWWSGSGLVGGVIHAHNPIALEIFATACARDGRVPLSVRTKVDIPCVPLLVAAMWANRVILVASLEVRHLPSSVSAFAAAGAALSNHPPGQDGASI